jgi:transposase
MNAVGIDVSKGKSMVAILRPFGEVVASPFEVGHAGQELSALAKRLLALDGETKVVMECTGSYYLPVACALREAGLFVSAVHAKLIFNFDNDSIRRKKTDKADAIKIANYALTKWLKLSLYVPEEDIRKLLRICSRQYSKYGKLKTMLKNNFIALTDHTFPGVNELFTSPVRADGHQKWLDFATKFWHCGCVRSLTFKGFTERYRRWCKQGGYRFSERKAEDIYASASGHCSVLPKNDSTELLMNQAAGQLNSIAIAQAAVAGEMLRLAQMLPEWPVVSAFYGVGGFLGPQLMAEIGDVRRFEKKGSLVQFAGLCEEPYQSGKFNAAGLPISKKGSPHLRKTLFQAMDVILQNKPADDPIFQFLDRKRAEKKHYYNYMTSGSAKFLRIYYARVKQHLVSLEER